MEEESSDPRKKVAKEAASMLYFGVEKEYKQAKVKAAETFGRHHLPTNLEIAVEFDRIAEDSEGLARQEHLIKMRREALRLMSILELYKPVLVGSVWRGTIHRDSDIDIIVHHDEPKEVLKTLVKNGLRIEKSEWVKVTEQGKRRASFHIHLGSQDKEKAEIIVRSPDEACLKEKCEIYRDEVTGLTTGELERILEENPTKRFVPV